MQSLQDNQHAAAAALPTTRPEILRFWRELGLLGAIGQMERHESWAVDGMPETEEIFAHLLQRMATLPGDAMQEVVNEAPRDLIDLLGYMRSGRALATFRWLTTFHSESAAEVLANCRVATDDDFAFLMLERLMLIDKLGVLSRVFSSERIGFITELIEELKNED